LAWLANIANKNLLNCTQFEQPAFKGTNNRLSEGFTLFLPSFFLGEIMTVT
jgi:hypothetical protein